LTVIERPITRGTIATLERQLEAYESAFGITTEKFLVIYHGGKEHLADLDEVAVPWFETFSTLSRLREEGEAPTWCFAETERLTEGSKEPSIVFYGYQAVHRLSRYQDRQPKDSLSENDCARN
jgi:hypothetical protein